MQAQSGNVVSLMISMLFCTYWFYYLPKSGLAKLSAEPLAR